MTDTKEQIISYQQLRTFIGLIGIFLPFVLVLGCYAHGDGGFSFQPSISHYYYSKMHIAFVAALCVLGGFLITYKGKKNDPWESRISNLAGYSALGVASFPTQFGCFRTNANRTNQYLQVCKDITLGWGRVHFAFAGVLFGCFVLFCLWFFQKPDAHFTEPEDIKKLKRRQSFYKFCGWGILVSIISLTYFSFFVTSNQGWLEYTTFTFETTSLWLFGAAWLVKGSLFWKHYPILSWLIKPLR